MKKLMLIVGLVALVSLTSMAQTPVINGREASQRVRIHHGRASGEITRTEARHLNRQQRRIHRSERWAKADGHVSPREKARITRKQNRASRNIRRAGHNGFSY